MKLKSANETRSSGFYINDVQANIRHQIPVDKLPHKHRRGLKRVRPVLERKGIGTHASLGVEMGGRTASEEFGGLKGVM